MHIRKQVYELTTDDLRQFPVWEFALDEEGDDDQDEATVRPTESAQLDGSCIALARFTFADSTTAVGYLTPSQDKSDLGAIQPVVISHGGQVAFWCGTIEPRRRELRDYYSLLSKSPDKMFPIDFESAIELPGGVICGTIPGFLVLESFSTGNVKVIA